MCRALSSLGYSASQCHDSGTGSGVALSSRRALSVSRRFSRLIARSRSRLVLRAIRRVSNPADSSAETCRRVSVRAILCTLPFPPVGIHARDDTGLSRDSLLLSFGVLRRSVP